jgi:hypothetical protein
MSIGHFDAHKFLVDHLCETTPEKRALLTEEIQRLGIRFDLDTSSPGIDFWADPVTNVVNVPVKCLTRQRAQSYAYYSIEEYEADDAAAGWLLDVPGQTPSDRLALKQA